MINQLARESLAEVLRTDGDLSSRLRDLPGLPRQPRGASRRTLQRSMTLAYRVDLKVALAIDADAPSARGARLPADPEGTTVVGLTAVRALQVEVVRTGKPATVPFEKAATAKALGLGPGALGDVGVRRRGKRTVLVIEVPVERGSGFLKRLR